MIPSQARTSESYSGQEFWTIESTLRCWNVELSYCYAAHCCMKMKHGGITSKFGVIFSISNFTFFFYKFISLCKKALRISIQPKS